eukprot:3905894-Prymnesium_polylepis.1
MQEPVAFAVCFLSPFLLLGTPPTTVCTVGNSSMLALRVPHAVSDANKTLAGFDRGADLHLCVTRRTIVDGWPPGAIIDILLQIALALVVILWCAKRED